MPNNKGVVKNLQPNGASIPIVAIGASAGGLEAISQILENLSPATGLAFVYIQHISPTHNSQLSSILGRVTKMPVVEAGDLQKVLADHVYIIPPNKDMEIVDGFLTLIPRKPKPSIDMPIDKFFMSLAERQKAGAIGVVLSGLAHDGTLGLKAIKVAGGITIVQDETAKYQSMPKSAIAEGIVDLILSPQQIAKELERLSKQPELLYFNDSFTDQEENDTSDEDLKNILGYLNKTLEVDFSNYKITTIRRRIIRRMLLYKLENLQEYFEYLRKQHAEADILYNDLLINVTNFFRDKDTMEYLKKVLLPQVIKNKQPRETIRIWVPACSTGQEAYSIAILLMEVIGDLGIANISIQIFASDLSEMAIAKARIGTYSKSEIQDVSPKRIQRFFSKIEDQYRINKSIRDLCVFAPHNVLRDPPFSRLDLISCRNLLIYLDNNVQQKVISTFHYALNPDGFLLLGKSETVGGAAFLFSQVEKNHKVYTRRNGATGKASFDMKPRWSGAVRLEEFDFQKGASRKSSSSVSVNDLDRTIDNLLLSEYVPASVVVDQDLEILQFRGSTGLFLEPSPGKASFNLLKMARTSMVFELRNTVHKARKSGQITKKSGLEVKVGEKIHQVDIEVVPLKNVGEQKLFLVMFKEVTPNQVTESKSTHARNHRIKQLEEELASLKDDMHSIIEEQEASNEELQSANEEIVSSNEELQSINEELETSKEEIESTNEELLTINQELQVRNDQLSEAYGYAEAIFGTIREATLLLDKELRVKSANKAFYNIFRVTEDDTEGRMFYELDNRKWDIPELRHMLEEVIFRGVFIRGFEVKRSFTDLGDKIMLLHGRKVVQHQRQEAILLVIEDVTEQREVQRLLEERQAWFQDLINNAPTLIWVASTDGRVNFLNRALLEFTGHSMEDELRVGWTQGIHPEERRHYLTSYAVSLQEKKEFSSEYRLMRSDGEYRWMMEISKPMFASTGEFTGFIGTCTEIHLQKTITEELNIRVEQRTHELSQANEDLGNANKKLRTTADRLQSVLNAVPAAISLLEVITDEENDPVDFRTSVFNEPALQLTGETAESITEKTVLESQPYIKESGLFDLYIKVLASGESEYKEIGNLRKEIDDSLAFFITRQVDNSGLVVTILDITERKSAELKIIETKENLQAVLDSFPGSIGFLKPVYSDGRIEDFILAVCNQRFSTEFDKPLTKLVGMGASELYSYETIELMEAVLSSGESYYEEVFDPISEIWTGISIMGHDHGVVITGLNINALKQAEQQQSKWMQELEGSSEMVQSLAKMRQYVKHRGEFLRSTTHDLRSSVGVILGATALLDIIDTEESRARTLTMIQRNLRKVAEMMNQLLDFSRLESGQEQLHITEIDASVVLTELAESVVPIANGKGLEIKYEGPEILQCQGDEVKIRRIANNLIVNAIRYTESGSVTISWGIEEKLVNDKKNKTKNWYFTVADTGTGMSPDKVNEVTLFNSDGESKKVTEKNKLPNGDHSDSGQGIIPAITDPGEGIGLYIVKRLCELISAKMEVVSKPGEGTIFRISLPMIY